MNNLLEGFKPFSFGNTGPALSITKNGVTFNKAAAEKIGNPQFVLLFINDKTQQIAIKKSPMNDPNAIPFCAAIKKGAPSVRWNSKELLRTICSITGWNLTSEGCTGYKVFGTMDKSEGALIFDLSNATENT